MCKCPEVDGAGGSQGLVGGPRGSLDDCHPLPPSCTTFLSP